MTIPEYVQQYIDPYIDLNVTTKICCIFHEEKTPSMSYSATLGKLTCFGKCHKVWNSIEEIHKDYFGVQLPTQRKERRVEDTNLIFNRAELMQRINIAKTNKEEYILLIDDIFRGKYK